MSTGRGPIVAAVFDFDGTLVDTMPLHYEAYRQAVAECCGADLDQRSFLAHVGGTAGEVVPRLLRHVGCSADPVVVHRRKRERLREILDDAEIPVLETAKLLALLRPHLKIGLASSGSREGIETMLTRLEWTDTFDVVITGDDVERGKPAPDPYLLAAAGLGVDPSQCMAFEDTDPGVRSAQAAGMTVFDVRATQPPRP